MPTQPSTKFDIRPQQLQDACRQLSSQLHSGAECSAEQLFLMYPLLADDPEFAVELLAHEYHVRRQLNHSITLNEFVSRYPQWSERLRSHLNAPTEATVARPSVRNDVDDTPTGAGLQPERLAGLEGSSFGQHVLLKVLDRGGMGVVWLARHKMTNEVVALKMIANGMLASRMEVQRFLSETRASAKLDHPNIVRVFEVGCENNEFYYTMALMAGGSLAKSKSRFGEARAAATLGAKLADAVAYAHDKGIIHRDLKPGNILLDEHGEPRISDFGLAKQLGGSDDLSLSRSGHLIGTPQYTSPEQAQGDKDRVGPASDIWSLGVILYEVVTGRLPFQAGTLDALIAQIKNEEPRFPGSLCPERCPRDLEAIILKCLEKDPARRYPTAMALRDDLQRFANNQPVATRVRPARRLARAKIPLRRLAAALLVVGLLAGALVAGLLLVKPRLEAPRADPKEVLLGQLRDGKEIVLIGDTGLPAWSQRDTGNKDLELAVAPEEPTTSLETFRTALIELVPDPQRQTYRFRADVKNDGGQAGETGMYFLAANNMTKDGRVCQYVFTINCVHWTPKPMFSLNGRRREPDSLGEKCTIAAKPMGPEKSPWHTIEASVSPEKIEVLADGQKLWSGSLDHLAEQIDRIYPSRQPDSPPATISLRGPIGLFGLSTSGFFKNVVFFPN